MKQIFIGVAFVTMSFFVIAQNAIRVDFFRTGNSEKEMISVKNIYLQNNISVGKDNFIDEKEWGSYIIEAYTVSDNKLFFRRGYSSLFNEWVATTEAEKINRSFEESILIPYVSDSVRLVFNVRSRKGIYEKQFDFAFSPKVDGLKNHYTPYNVKDIYVSGKSEKKLDILFVPDGYSESEMAKFEKDAKRFADYFLNAKPMCDYKKSFNIRAIMAASEESGVDLPHKDIYKRTLLNSSFNTFKTERYLTTLSYHKLMDVCANAPADHVVIIANTSEYGGGGFYNFFTMAAAEGHYSDFLLQHEIGHGLFGLGDEYYTSDVAVEDFYPLDVEPWEPNITTLVNFDSKWKSMLKNTVPVPTPATSEYKNVIGVFEGGGYMAKGVYRPAYDCTMQSPKYDFMCEVCCKACVNIIKWYAK